MKVDHFDMHAPTSIRSGRLLGNENTPPRRRKHTHRFLLVSVYSPASSLKSQLGTAPVTTLGIPLDGIVRAHSDPLWQGAILPLRFRQSALGSERLLGWL
jgi:hypothetical protein